jgi:hypothetical protein
MTICLALYELLHEGRWAGKQTERRGEANKLIIESGICERVKKRTK